MLTLTLASASLPVEGRRKPRLPHRTSAGRLKASTAPDLRRPDADDNPDEMVWKDFLRVREPDEVIASLDSNYQAPMTFNPIIGPRLFTGYLPKPEDRYTFTPSAGWKEMMPMREPQLELSAMKSFDDGMETADRLAWMQYQYFIDHPDAIEMASWLLPELPQLPADNYSFTDYVRRLRLPALKVAGVGLTKRKIERVNWLHTFNGGIQFSQAYLSRNWYQGGNDYLALLINLNWNVTLNQAYHSNLLFQNTVSYKLGLNSTSQDEYHKYSISEDLLQWNMNFGVKARDKWYYSLTAQFKTQVLNSYAENSMTRTAAFLSPGELNVGLGMTYSLTKKRHYKSMQLKVAISPLSYNLKTCLDRNVDPTQFGIAAHHVAKNEIGSSAETTLVWDITGNINYRTRFFVFTDYRNYSQDWENTLSFNINRFLSTQIYAHLRYDTSGASIDKWGHWMLKEILSFGFSYAFSTK